jgi:hypothetical protein
MCVHTDLMIPCTCQPKDRPWIRPFPSSVGDLSQPNAPLDPFIRPFPSSAGDLSRPEPFRPMTPDIPFKPFPHS